MLKYKIPQIVTLTRHPSVVESIFGGLLWRKWDIQQKKVRRNDEPFCSSSWT